MLGTFITDMNMGIYTAKLDRARTILATTEAIQVQYHRYNDIQFADYLEALNQKSKIKNQKTKILQAPQSPHRPHSPVQVRADRSADHEGRRSDSFASPG